jgi:hypothetical protein
MTLTIYDMPEQPGAAAFGLFQEWQTGQKQPGIWAFQHHSFFGVVESPLADGDTLARFGRALETTLLP